MTEKNRTADTTEEMKGTVRKIVYRNDTYHVFRLVSRGVEVIAVGHFSGLTEGDSVLLVGKWGTHKQFGKQFVVESYYSEAPTTVSGIKAYLAGGRIKGVGKKFAEKIVDYFGEETLKIIHESPERLIEVPGIGNKKAQKIQANVEKYKETEKIMVALQGYGVSTAYAVRIHHHFEGQAVDVLTSRPYDLTEVPGIGFLIADKIATGIGVDKNDPMRLRAGLVYVLKTASTQGHVCLPQNILLAEAKKILECDKDVAAQTIEELVREEKLLSRCVDADREDFYLPSLYWSEVGVSSRIKLLCETAEGLAEGEKQIGKLVSRAEKQLGVTLAEQQKLAVRMAVEKGVMVLTGGPGTGKTTIMKAIVDIYEGMDCPVVLAAPTGRAAQRLSESTGRPAQTLHRLLGISKGGVAIYNREHPMDNVGLLVVDEASMLDMYLANQLLQAIENGTRLLLVGDVDQLPSVGPGRVLLDIIDSGVVPTVRLDQIFRQAAGSLIIQNAHRINRGAMPMNHKEASLPDPDYFFMQEEDPEKLRDLIIDLAVRRIPDRYGVDSVRDIQVLSPMRKGPIGVNMMNEMLQARLNSSCQSNGDHLACLGTRFFVGDKVMQVRNNYDKKVFNGETGIVTCIDKDEDELYVDFPIGTVKYAEQELSDLSLAYCVSIHKSQGSEYPVVLIPVHTQHWVMLQKNLLYTGLTRGKNLAVLAGMKKALAMAVKNNKTPERHSHLVQLLKGDLEPASSRNFTVPWAPQQVAMPLTARRRETGSSFAQP